MKETVSAIITILSMIAIDKMAESLYSYPLTESESIRIYELCGSNESKEMARSIKNLESSL